MAQGTAPRADHTRTSRAKRAWPTRLGLPPRPILGGSPVQDRVDVAGRPAPHQASGTPKLIVGDLSCLTLKHMRRRSMVRRVMVGSVERPA